MTTTPTSVDIQGMTQAQQDFQQALDEINSVYNAMSQERDTLAANWAGEASSAFGQALGTWLDDLFAVQQELIIMTESLSIHTGVYANATETSNEVANAFQHGLSGLDGLPDPTTPHMTARLAASHTGNLLAAGSAVPFSPTLRVEPSATTPAVPLQPELYRTYGETAALLPAGHTLRMEASPTVPPVPLQPEVYRTYEETAAMPAIPAEPPQP